MLNFGKSVLTAAITAALYLSTPGWAAAQGPDGREAGSRDGDPARLESVEVTARGVTESVQKTPIPVTAVSEQMIEQKGLMGIQDISKLVPGFSITPSFGRTNEVPVIRGMSNIAQAMSAEPVYNASLFIDGVYVGTDMSAFNLESVERVEVLRGPQAAAFGRSTFAGAINYITRSPGAWEGGKLRVGAGSKGQRKYSFLYSGASETGVIGYEVGLNRNRIGSLYFNEASQRKDLGGTDTKAFSAALGIYPTENLDLVFRAARLETDDDHVALNLIGVENNNCYLPVQTSDPNDPDNFMVSRTKGYYCGNLPLPDSWNINTPGFDAIGRKAGLEGKSTRYSLKADYAFDNGWTLSSVTGYNEQERYAGFDQSYQGIHNYTLSNGIQLPGALGTFTLVRSKDQSQSIRLSSDQSRPFAGLLGLYYYKFEGLPGWNGTLASPVETAVDPGNKTTNKAVYAQARWQFTEKWTTSLEARYAEDDLTLDGSSSVALAGQGGGVYTNVYTAKAKYTSFTPRWTLSYQARENINLFGLIARGNKPGGFNTFVFYGGLTDDARKELLDRGFDKVQEEKVTNYELGLKSDWLDNTLRVNANLYRMDWDNQGLSLATSAMQWNGVPYNTTYTINIGETRVQGLELETHWLFRPGWTASLVYAYTDSEIRSFINQDQADILSTVDNPNPGMSSPLASLAGKRSPLVPRTKLTASLVHEGVLPNGWGYFASWDTSYQSMRYLQVHNLAKLGATSTSNIRASVSPTERLRITGYVSNLFNDKTPQGGIRYLSFGAPYISVPLIEPAVGRQMVQQRDFGVTAPMPRMYGVELSFEF